MFSNPLIGEAMAQPFYPADDELSFGSHPKRDALSIQHTIQGDGRPDIVDRNLACAGTAQEIEAKCRAPTRRRIPVAVSSQLTSLIYKILDVPNHNTVVRKMSEAENSVQWRRW